MPEQKSLELPYNFILRPYQERLWDYMDNDTPGKRAVWIVHRRGGKDKTLLNITISQMFRRRGSYYYFFPTFKQGRRVLWEGIDRDGFKFMDHFPPEIVKRKNDTTMTVETTFGSIFQIIGTDNYNAIVGSNPVGCVFSEFSLQDPNAWAFIRPILAENGGWAVFNYTPRGHNHGYELLKLAQNQTEWFAEVLDVTKTNAISPAILKAEREEMYRLTGSDALYLQEYMCDFSVPIIGAYYASQLSDAELGGRITAVPWIPELPVHTAWDLGISDSTTIWFYQIVGSEVHIIDYYENSGEGMEFYFKELQKKPYTYGKHFGPHDLGIREFTSGKSRIDIARTLGFNFEILPNLSVQDGIMSARMLFNRCWFDATKCERGLDALKNYRKEFDEKNRIYKDHPLHDWASHGADGFRYMSLSIKPDVYVKNQPAPAYQFKYTNHDPY